MNPTDRRGLSQSTPAAGAAQRAGRMTRLLRWVRQTTCAGPRVLTAVLLLGGGAGLLVGCPAAPPSEGDSANGAPAADGPLAGLDGGPVIQAPEPDVPTRFDRFGLPDRNPPQPDAGGPLDVTGANDCCLPVGFGETGSDNAPDEETIIAALYQVDSDGDGESDGSEAARGADPFDPTDGDADGDGLENGDDPDVDGDGLANGEDGDIDGDGLDNGDDDDMDGDGLINADDDDDDGDGIPDAEDEDDDADGEDDCECEHGTCSDFKGLCFCEPGWKGEDCDEFTCHDVNDCNNGTCVGPNSCRCNRGWETGAGGGPCAVFHCRDLANCNGHGQCTGANVCTCDDGWKGTPDCRQPTCVSSPSSCDDGDPCTSDVCDPATGCTHEPVVCTLFEACVGGDCVPSCDNTSNCDAGQACKSGGCVDECDSDSDCRDGNPCTIDMCNTDAECENEPVLCSLFEECVRGKCVEGCDDDFDCEFNEFCVDGGCFSECDSDSDCADDETCDSSENACLPSENEDEEGQQ